VVLQENDLAHSQRSTDCWKTHNFAEREPITSASTVGRGLGKGRFAQRFLGFHGKDGVAGSIPAGGST
jgi:hypothetical protein